MSNTYKPKQGEKWDEVSYKVYGTDEYMHILLKANLPLSHLLSFTGSEVLVIPDIPEKEFVVVPPWGE